MALHNDCMKCHGEVVMALLEKSADVNLESNFNEMPLFHAPLKGRRDIAAIILLNGAIE